MTGGPTNPDKVKEAIDLGARHGERDCLVIDEQNRWLRVDGEAWEISEIEAIQITRETFDDVASATPEGPFLRVGGVLKKLEPVTGYATLLPA